MRYRMEKAGNEFVIINVDADYKAGYVDYKAGHFIIRDDDGNDVAVLQSVDEALAIFAAYRSAYPPQWRRSSATEFQKCTDYGDLRVRRNSLGQWIADRNDVELVTDEGRPATFRTRYEAQYAADLHMGEAHPNAVKVSDGLAWRVDDYDCDVYRMESRLGEVLADAVFAIAGVRMEFRWGHLKVEPGQLIDVLIAELSSISKASRFGCFDPNRGREPYFSADLGTKRPPASRLSFPDAARHYGTMVLRERLGPNASEAALQKKISEVLKLLAEHIQRAPDGRQTTAHGKTGAVAAPSL